MLDLADVYLVNPVLKVASKGDVERAEKTLGTKFPKGYADFVTKFGTGLFNDVIRVYAPDNVVDELEQFRNRIEEYYFWDQSEDLISKERVKECIWIADTLNGDEVIFHPDNPARLYLLPRDSEEIEILGKTLNDALEQLLKMSDAASSDTILKFDSLIGRKNIKLVLIKKRPPLSRVKASIVKLGLHDRIEEAKRPIPLLCIYSQKLGGFIHCAGLASSYKVTISHSVDQDDAVLGQFLAALEALGFVVPTDEHGKPHPAITNLKSQYYQLNDLFPCPIPASERSPKHVVTWFIKVMHAYEPSREKWNKDGLPLSIANDLCAEICADLCVPGASMESFGIPSQFAPENEKPGEEIVLVSGKKVEITTEVGDRFQTQHRFVLKKQHDGWRLAELWSKNGVFSQLEPNRILYVNFFIRLICAH
jgi:hypothetical protein